MARSTLTELVGLPEKVTDPNWLESVEGNGQEDGEPIQPASGSQLRTEQAKAKARRQNKTRDRGEAASPDRLALAPSLVAHSCR
jgi:hypothetical protein